MVTNYGEKGGGGYKTGGGGGGQVYPYVLFIFALIGQLHEAGLLGRKVKNSVF